MTSGSSYRPDIDGLRAVAVLAVVAYHAFPAALPGGFVGVDVFFVISGYLISGIILGALAAGRFSFTHFYARRIKRIFPALSLVLAAVAVAGWFLLYADDYARLGRHIAAGAGFVSNFVLWGESSYFDGAVELKPLLHLWSLGIEEQFYLAWPLLLVAAWRWGRRGPLALTLAIGAASFLVSIWQVRIDRTPAFFSPWTRFWELLAGAMLASVEIDRALKARLDRFVVITWLSNALAIAGAMSIAAGLVLIDGTRVFPGLWVLLPVAGTFLLLVAGPRAWLNRTVLSWHPVVWVGLISYPLYLWHWPLLSFGRLVSGPLPDTTRFLLIGASVVLAWLTYRLLEWPIRFGSRRRAIVPSLAAAMVVLLAVGLTTQAAGGFLERPINRSDAAHLVDFYERMRKQGLRSAYRAECDFMDWQTENTRASIDPSCTAPGSARTVFLWGDSYAQSLSPGLREQLPAGTSLAQVTTSACRAGIDNFDVVRDRRCEIANVFAMDSIRRLRPALVIVAQSGAHSDSDWSALTRKIVELGAARVAVVGPFPSWQTGLPRVFAEHHMGDRPEYVATGISADLFEQDRLVAARVKGLPQVSYVSLVAALCREGACLARVPGEYDLDLMAMDAGHLTPKGSSYVGRQVMKPVLDQAGVR